MTYPQQNPPYGNGLAVNACWVQTGVQGDHSCEKLAEVGHCRNCGVFSEAGQSLFQREAPPEYIAEWTRQLAQPDAEVVTDSRSLLLVRIGPEWLALEGGNVVEVISPRPIHRVPHRSNQLLLGLANIRGELQLCVSLRELLGIDAPVKATPESTTSAPSRPRMVVVEHEQTRWVFPVDEVEGVHRIPAAALENLPYTVERSPRYYSQALFARGDTRVGVLSVARLFQTLERSIR